MNHGAASTPGGGKIATGIPGFDGMTGGGLPRGRVTAVIGGAGAGKTVFALQTAINLARQGCMSVIVSFEQSPEAVLDDMASFGWQAGSLVEAGQMLVLDGRPGVNLLLSGAFDIAGLLAAVGAAIDGKPHSCVVFDGLDALLNRLAEPAAQRQELLRLQDQARKLATTTILTIKPDLAASGGFEELALYLADCVIELTSDMESGFANRAIRVQKFRGSAHLLSRQPLLMTAQGIEVEGPLESGSLVEAPTQRLPTGIPRLDAMLAGGLFRGSCTLLSGAPGAAKTTLGTLFLHTMCDRGERALWIGFDEAPGEVIRNMTSVGIGLSRHVAAGLLRMHSFFGRTTGPDEMAHDIAGLIAAHRPRHVLIDPISTFPTALRGQNAVQRLIQLCKRQGITVMLTSLIDRATDVEATRSFVSTLCDAWIHLNYVINGGERNRALTIVKARGTAHSNQVAELLLTHDGLAIADVYTEDGAVLMGSLRWQKERANQEAIQAAAAAAAGHYRDVELAANEIARRIAGLTDELEAKRRELEQLSARAHEVTRHEDERRAAVLRLRGGDGAAAIGWELS